MLVGEFLTLSIDMTNLLAGGDTISNPTATIISLQTNETVPAALNTPTVSGSSIINITVDGSRLRAKTTYALTFVCTATGGGTNKTPGAILVIRMIQ
jgi:hypothetical protein